MMLFCEGEEVEDYRPCICCQIVDALRSEMWYRLRDDFTRAMEDWSRHDDEIEEREDTLETEDGGPYEGKQQDLLELERLSCAVNIAAEKIRESESQSLLMTLEPRDFTGQFIYLHD